MRAAWSQTKKDAIRSWQIKVDRTVRWCRLPPWCSSAASRVRSTANTGARDPNRQTGLVGHDLAVRAGENCRSLRAMGSLYGSLAKGRGPAVTHAGAAVRGRRRVPRARHRPAPAPIPASAARAASLPTPRYSGFTGSSSIGSSAFDALTRVDTACITIAPARLCSAISAAICSGSSSAGSSQASCTDSSSTTGIR